MTKEDINKLFREHGRTLGSVESFTGGLFASEIVSVSGASHFYKGGLVTYTNETKNRILGIKYDDIDQYGVVSQEIAGQMVGHAQRLLNVDYCISFTGNAGPEAMEGKKVGEIYIGIAAYDLARVFRFELEGSREEIARKAVEIGFELIGNFLLERK